MAKKSKRQRQRKKRKEIRKAKKARRQSMPALLRKDPLLRETLSFHHPLAECLINQDWEDQKFATIYITRDAPGGLVLGAFLVDLAGMGLKDCWGEYDLIEADIEGFKAQANEAESRLVACDPTLAAALVYGGIQWARKWKFKLPREYKVWLRLLEPVQPDSGDLARFGENGKPFLILDEDELDIFEEADFYPQLLKADLVVGTDGLAPETLERIADIKGALISYSRRTEFKPDFEAARFRRYGNRERPEDENEWIGFQDWFVLECELESGETIIGRFVEQYNAVMSLDVRRLLLGWKNVIDGLFEIEAVDKNFFRLENLINERNYRVYATGSMEDPGLQPGDFLAARIVPALEFHVFSGAVSIFQTEGNEQQRAEMYQTARDIQLKNPRLAFRDNPQKLQKSRKVVAEQHEDFVNYFGADEVFGTGKEILQKYRAFMDYQVYEKVNPKTGLTPAQFYEKNTGKAYRPPEMRLPREMTRSRDVAMLHDLEEGICFLIDYRRFINVFRYPWEHPGKKALEALVLGYLTSEMVSDLPFKRVAARFPRNFKKIMRSTVNIEQGDPGNVEDLMMEFKPYTLQKFPHVVVTLIEDKMLGLSAK
ncbi:MAG: hypothetical protein PVF71_08620 [Desulfobacterales bacterium]|jgi:hypothetical protein